MHAHIVSFFVIQCPTVPSLSINPLIRLSLIYLSIYLESTDVSLSIYESSIHLSISNLSVCLYLYSVIYILLIGTFVLVPCLSLSLPPSLSISRDCFDQHLLLSNLGSLAFVDLFLFAES